MNTSKLTQEQLSDIQKIFYDKYDINIYVQNLLIFNNDFLELQRINHLGKKSVEIDSQLNTAVAFLDFIKKQKKVIKPVNFINSIPAVDNKITNIDEFEEETQQPVSKILYRKFNDLLNPLEKSFPYPTIRPQQQRILDLLRKCDDKKFIIIEAMPGTGKSAIAKTILKHCGNGYILTATKQLQDQYIKEFPDIVAIKGKNSYKCSQAYHEMCGNGPCIRNNAFLKECRMHHLCPYMEAKDAAKVNPLVVTSYAYFFTWLNTKYKMKFSPREILLLDEAHLLDNQMTAWTELILNPLHLEQQYHLSDFLELHEVAEFINCPKFEENYTDYNQLIINTIYKLLQKIYQLMIRDLNNASDKNNPMSILNTTWGDNRIQAISDVRKRYMKVLDLKTDLDQILIKLKLFIDADNKKEWLLIPQQNDTDKTAELSIKPLYMSKLFRTYVEKFGVKHIIFMSATILNARIFCEELGIKQDEVAIIKVDSAFDPARSPILYNPVGKMNYNCLNNTMPKIIDMVRKILLNHPNEKGIIHTGNYSIATKICSVLRNKRLMMKTAYENNETLLRRHAKTSNGVLVSPSLGTGTDLKDDAARFQIIIKLPFMSLSDQRIKKKAEIDYDWYSCEMLRALIQSSGRATRSEDDYSITYVLDSSFKYWINKYIAWLPKSFLQRIYWSGYIPLSKDF